MVEACFDRNEPDIAGVIAGQVCLTPAKWVNVDDFKGIGLNGCIYILLLSDKKVSRLRREVINKLVERLIGLMKGSEVEKEARRRVLSPSASRGI